MNVSTKQKVETNNQLDVSSLSVPSNGSISSSERKAFHDTIAEMGATDAAFRADFIRDPKGVLENYANKILGRSLEMSPQAQVHVLEDTIDVLNVVLPIEGSARAEVLEMGALTPLIRRAGQDSSFRQGIIAAPQESVSHFLAQAGTPIPDFIKVKVTEISDSDAVVFMPAMQPSRGSAATEVTANQASPQMSYTEGGCYTMYCRTTDDCHQTNTTTLNASCPTYTYQPRC